MTATRRAARPATPAPGTAAPAPDPSGRRLFRRLRFALIVAVTSANLVGAAVVIALATLVVPDIPPIAGSLLLTVLAAVAYVVVAVPVGIRIGMRRFRHVREWLLSGEEPTERQRRAVLRGAFRLTRSVAALWAVGALLFGTIDFFQSPLGAAKTVLIVSFGGMTTCAITYLLAERISRPAAARMMAAGGGGGRSGLGVAWRMVLTWLLATGVPLLGLVLLGVAALAGAEQTRVELALATVSLAGVAFLAGSSRRCSPRERRRTRSCPCARRSRRSRRATSTPRCPSTTATEVGLLQAGFNRMAAGLREREHLRDLFGRHVGEDVARAAIDGGVELGGETREVAVLFVDLVGSTTLAARRPPEEVVGLLNRFFAVVVEVVESHGGSVNKFEGDAALAVFGAPVPMADPWTCTLRAARELCSRLRSELPEVDAGIGVSGGEAVAGNVGAAHRFEYTVIGDPVNEAARLTELAKTVDARALASQALVDRAARDERSRWQLEAEVELRGRETPTRVWVPA